MEGKKIEKLQPVRISVEKIYKIDDAGNADVERSWILHNPNDEVIDLNEYGFYVVETVPNLGNLKVFDSNGNIECSQEEEGDEVEILVKLSNKKLGSLQDYKITLQYHLPNFAHKLDDTWFFTDTIYGIEEIRDSPFLKRMDVKIQVFLPNLKKTFLQKRYHESYPDAKDCSGADIQTFKGKTVLEWNRSLSARKRFQFHIFYGIKTNAKLTSFITFIASTIIGALIKLGFDLLSGG